MIAKNAVMSSVSIPSVRKSLQWPRNKIVMDLRHWDCVQEGSHCKTFNGDDIWSSCNILIGKPPRRAVEVQESESTKRKWTAVMKVTNRGHTLLPRIILYLRPLEGGEGSGSL